MARRALAADPPLCTREELPTRRERELECACAALGIEPPHLLDYRDGELATRTWKGSLRRSLPQWVAQAAKSCSRSGRMGSRGTATMWLSGAVRLRHSAVPSASAHSTQSPCRLAWPKRWACTKLRTVPDAEIALAVDVSAAWEAKRAAMRCHATQVSATPLLQAPLEVQRRFFGVEHFVRAAVSRDYDDFFSDVLKRIPSTGHRRFDAQA